MLHGFYLIFLFSLLFDAGLEMARRVIVSELCDLPGLRRKVLCSVYRRQG